MSSVPGFFSCFSVHYVPVCTEKMGGITRLSPTSSTRQFSLWSLMILQLTSFALIPVIVLEIDTYVINKSNTGSHVPWFLELCILLSSQGFGFQVVLNIIHTKTSESTK